MTSTWMADTYRKEGNDNGLYDSIRAINGDGDDAVHAQSAANLPMCGSSTAARQTKLYA